MIKLKSIVFPLFLTGMFIAFQASSDDTKFDACDNCSTSSAIKVIETHYPEPRYCPDGEEDGDECEEMEEGFTHYVIDRVSRTGRVFNVEYNKFDIRIDEESKTTQDIKYINLAIEAHDVITNGLQSLGQHWSSQITPKSNAYIQNIQSAQINTCPDVNNINNMTVYTPLYNAAIASQMLNDVNKFVTPDDGAIDTILSGLGFSVGAEFSVNLIFESMSKGRIVQVTLENGGVLTYDLTADVDHNGDVQMWGEIALNKSKDAEGTYLNTRFVRNSNGSIKLHPSFTTQKIVNNCLAKEYNRVKNSVNGKSIEHNNEELDYDSETDSNCDSTSSFSPVYEIVWTGIHGDTSPSYVFIGMEQDDDGFDDC
jgi:hypothetical protein